MLMTKNGCVLNLVAEVIKEEVMLPEVEEAEIVAEEMTEKTAVMEVRAVEVAEAVEVIEEISEVIEEAVEEVAPMENTEVQEEDVVVAVQE